MTGIHFGPIRESRTYRGGFSQLLGGPDGTLSLSVSDAWMGRQGFRPWIRSHLMRNFFSFLESIIAYPDFARSDNGFEKVSSLFLA